MACLLCAGCNKNSDPPIPKANKDKPAVPPIPSMGQPGVPQQSPQQKSAGAQIEGTIQLGKDVKYPVNMWAGFVGKDGTGKPVSPGVGFPIEMIVEGSSQFASCETFKPLLARLDFDAEKGWTFKHEGLPPGTYLVYARWNDGHFFDAKWVTVKDASETVKVTLTVDPDLAGNLEVQIPNLSKDTEVEYIPLDDQGKIPLADVPMRNWYEGKVKVKEPKTVVDNVRAGKYRVTAYPFGGKPMTADVEVTAGKTTTAELKESK
jgi:hypothetical protein